MGDAWRRGVLRFLVVETRGIGVRWGDSASAGGEDELCWFWTGALNDEHVAAGAVEEGREDLAGGCGTVGAEDALIGDAAGDLHAGEAGDVAQDLVEAGVVSGDGEEPICVLDVGAVGGALGWGG